MGPIITILIALLCIASSAWAQNKIDPSGWTVLSTSTTPASGFDASHDETKLTDGCTDYVFENNCTTGNTGITQFMVEYDMGQAYTLSSARLWGNVVGTWVCTTWTLETKVNLGDSYTARFTGQPCNGDSWFTQPISSVSARYARVTVNGSPSTEANEFELYAGDAPAPTTSYYVSPTGAASSGCTSSGGPYCSLNTGLSLVQAGEEVVLTNGTYVQTVFISKNGTASQRITLRAQNERLAIIRDTATTSSNGATVTLNGSYWTIKDLVIDGNSVRSWCLRVGTTNTSGTPRTIEPIIENNEIRNCGGPGISTWPADDLIIRFNTIHDTGKVPERVGEGIYLGVGVPLDDPRVNLRPQVYGNTITRNTHNHIDPKSNIDANIHHNIFEDSPNTKESCLALGGGRNLYIHDNILRNSNCSSRAMSFLGGGNIGTLVTNNVIYNINSPTAAVGFKTPDAATPVNRVTGNTFCNMGSYVVADMFTGSTTQPPGIDVSANTGIPGGAAQSVCNAEVTRILAELADLQAGTPPDPPPACSPNCGVGTAPVADARIEPANPNCGLITLASTFLEVASCDSAKLNADATTTGTDLAVTSLVLVGTNQVRVCFADPFVEGETVDFDLAAAFCTNINSVTTDAVTNQAVVNTIGTLTITQAAFRFVVHERGYESVWRPGTGVGINTTDTIAKSGRFTVAINLKVAGEDAPNQSYAIWGNFNDGAYAPLTATCATGVSCVAEFVPLTNDQEDTLLPVTTLIDDDPSFTNNPAIINDGSPETGGILLRMGDEVDLRWSLQIPDDAAIGNKFCWRIYTGEGAALDTYTATPCATVRPGRMIIGF